VDAEKAEKKLESDLGEAEFKILKSHEVDIEKVSIRSSSF